jgi:O-acetyl-ADP-ribose deacetylase
MTAMNAVRANITTLQVDAIVNAANSSLLGGGGVDGAIHRAAGADLLDACRRLRGCKVGQAKITPGFNLPARYVIHTVGPHWRGGTHGEEALLAACYRNSLALEMENDIGTLAFPCISTGAYGYPIELAAEVALSTVKSFGLSLPRALEVTFCCFSEADLNVYRGALRRFA